MKNIIAVGIEKDLELIDVAKINDEEIKERFIDELKQNLSTEYAVISREETEEDIKDGKILIELDLFYEDGVKFERNKSKFVNRIISKGIDTPAGIALEKAFIAMHKTTKDR